MNKLVEIQKQDKMVRNWIINIEKELHAAGAPMN